MALEPPAEFRRLVAAFLSRRRALLIACLLAAGWLYQQFQPPTGLRAPPSWPGLAGVTVVEPGRAPQGDRTIRLGGDRIESVSASGPPEPGDVRWRTFSKHYVLPGLIDLNVRQPPAFLHLQALTGLMYLSAGVTTVRDVGNFDGDLRATQAAIQAGSLIYPRLIGCGREVEGAPPHCPSSLVVVDASAADDAVAGLAAAGAGCVHVRDSVSPDIGAALAAAARGRNLPLIAGSPVAGAPFVPTLAPWHLSFVGLPSDAVQEPFQTYLPAAFRSLIWPAQVRSVEAISSTPEMAGRAMASAVAARATGARLLLGSGAPTLYAAPGGSARLTIEILIALGISREEVWAEATRGAGEVVGIPQLGRIEPGAPADLLVFREDPTQHAEAITTLEAVISRGRLFPAATLIGQILEHVRYQDRWPVRMLRTLQARWLLWWGPATLLGCQRP